MTDLKDVLDVPKTIFFQGKKVSYRKLNPYDLDQLRDYIIELIEEKYLEEKKLCKLLKSERLRETQLDEATLAYINRVRSPSECDLVGSIEVQKYLVYLALDKKVTLKNCFKIYQDDKNRKILEDAQEKN